MNIKVKYNYNIKKEEEMWKKKNNNNTKQKWNPIINEPIKFSFSIKCCTIKRSTSNAWMNKVHFKKANFNKDNPKFLQVQVH